MLNHLQQYYLQQMGIETWVLRERRRRYSCSVLHRGNTDARLMIVGDVLAQGSGLSDNKLLVNMLKSIGFLAEDVHFLAVLQSAQRDNVELELQEQIALVSPQVILAMGPWVANLISNSTKSFENLRNHLHGYCGIPVLVSHHPESLLLNPIDKKHAYHDLLLVKQVLLNHANRK